MGKKSQAQAQVHLQEVKELGRSYIDKVGPGSVPPPCSSCTLAPLNGLAILAPSPFPPKHTVSAHLPCVSSSPLDSGDLGMNQI
jgi:hypothetical protein